MSRAKLWTTKFLKISVVFLIIFVWIFSGWPQIFNFPPEIQEARAAQFGRPSSDVLTGTWITAPLWEKIDETPYDDTDYVTSAKKASDDTFEVTLSNVTDPQSSSGHIIRYRAKNEASGNTVAIYLMQGATQIATYNPTLTTSFATYTYTLTSTEADNITDYADLRLKFVGNASAAKYVHVSWAEFEVPDVTTLGDGTDPGNSTVAPGSTNNYLDQFTFITSTGTDSVTALTVTTANTTAIASMEIWNEAMTTQYFTTVSSPVGDAWDFSGGTAIPVSTTSAAFRIIFTAKSHATLAEGTYAVTGTVTAYTCTNAKTGTDTDSATITVDNSPPTNATWGTITPGDSQIILNWTNPGADFYRELILRKTGSAVTDAPTEGTEYVQGNTIGESTVRYVGDLQTFTDTGLTNGTQYYYKIFAYDSYINYASGVGTGPHTPQAAPTLTFSISDTTIGFGTWSGTELRYATGDTNGSTTEPLAGLPTQLTASTNASNGLTITVRSTGDGSNAGLYKSTTPAKLIAAVASSAVSAGSEGYGVYGKNASLLTIDEGFDNDAISDLAVTTSAQTFASTTGAVSSGTVDLSAKAAIAGTTPAGSYSDALTLVCTGNF